DHAFRRHRQRLDAGRLSRTVARAPHAGRRRAVPGRLARARRRDRGGREDGALMTAVLLQRLPLRSPADVVAARQEARRVAERLGLDRQGQTRIATALSEIARNAFVHAGGGEIEFRVDARARPELYQLVVSDRGPGIADLEDI